MQVQGQGAAGGGIRQPPFESILFAPLIFAKVTSIVVPTSNERTSVDTYHALVNGSSDVSAPLYGASGPTTLHSPHTRVASSAGACFLTLVERLISERPWQMDYQQLVPTFVQ